MKNTKIMAILAVFLVAVLCVGAVSAATEDLTVKIENATGAETTEFYEGQMIVVNITGTGNADKLNVTYNDVNYQNTTAISEAGSKIRFTAVLGATQIKFDNVTAPTDGGYTIDGETLQQIKTITVNKVSKLSAGTSADNAPTLRSGYFQLTDKDGQPLPEGITFTSATGKPLVTMEDGVVQIQDQESGLYQNTTNGYYINVQTGTSPTALTLDGDNAVTAEDPYTLTINAGGDYAGKTATINWGDGSEPTTIASLNDGVNPKTYTYKEAKVYTITVTADGKSFTKTITVLAGDRKVNASELDSAFVYETVRVVQDVEQSTDTTVHGTHRPIRHPVATLPSGIRK